MASKYQSRRRWGKPRRANARRQTKKRAAFRPLFASLLGGEYYLRILRRSTIASAPMPSKPIVAGSGIAVGSIVPFRLNATCCVVEGRLSKRTHAVLALEEPP